MPHETATTHNSRRHNYEPNSDNGLAAQHEQRLTGPRGVDVAQAVADNEDVCIRPLAMRHTDTDTGHSRIVPVACGATRDAVCPPCARKRRRLRADQCRAGWHLDEEPPSSRAAPNEEQQSLLRYRADLLVMGEEAYAAGHSAEYHEIRDALDEVDTELRDCGVRGHLPDIGDTQPARRGRSTRRRADVPNLPRKPVAGRTIGRTYAAGRYRPSLFVTLTLDSYGPVHAARRRHGRIQPCPCGQQHHPDAAILGAPIDPTGYDYRRAARDAIHFSALVDRFWQNLRRAVGWDAQYFAAVEPQRRLAPHLHAAIRGSIPRALVRHVADATYHHVWWPHHGDPVYGGDQVPIWVPERGTFCDPHSRTPLPSFDESLPPPEVDSDQAAHTLHFGDQVDIRGVLGGSQEAHRHIGYMTKYLTKGFAETHANTSDAHRQHADRLLDELAITPCSPRCPVWLLHGIQPRNARSTTSPGHCNSNAHKRHSLGVSGRRVLVSRKWSGKTVAQHAQDRQNYVRRTLADAGITPPDTSHAEPFGNTTWEPVGPTDTDVPPRAYLLLQSVAEKRRRRAQYQRAIAQSEG